MSYQDKVLRDYPIGFWPLDELYTSVYTVANYNDAEFYNIPVRYDSFTIYSDSPQDISGCGNTGSYTGDFPLNDNLLPLVMGGNYGTNITNTGIISLPVTKDYYGSTISNGAFGNKYNSDNDFTLEVWFSQNITTTSETPIFADTENNIGIYWHNGDIVFKVSATESVRYCVPYTKKAFHVVATYAVNNINLYVDSVSVESKSLSNFKFTNSTVTLKVGPTLNVNDSFIVDAPAIYRYSLSPTSIRDHYIAGNISVSPIHVVYPDKGILFSGTDANIRAVFDYSYPADKPWTNFLDSNTYFDSTKKYITFYETDTVQSKTFVLEDYFFIPSQLGLVTSKVEWRNDLGITVETSVDGITYQQCTNGQPLPQYNKSSFDSSGKVYIRITMSTSDASKFLPKLMFFCITFYSDVTIFADNYGYKITSNSDYYLGSLNYPILSRNAMNGIKCKSGSGFTLNTDMAVKTLEFFYTPNSYNASGLVSSILTGSYAASNFSWNNSGIISKTNISKIYVNNLDKTSTTNVSDLFVLNQPHHVVIVYSSPISGDITFNYSVGGAIQGQFKNIAIYEKTFSAIDVDTHFEIYTGKPVETIVEPAITLTELSPVYYNNDWIVLQNI